MPIWNSGPVPAMFSPPMLQNQALGLVGFPSSFRGSPETRGGLEPEGQEDSRWAWQTDVSSSYHLPSTLLRSTTLY